MTEDQKKDEQEKYDLYTEHIVTSPWTKIKRVLKRIFLLIVMAAVFGLIAGLVMIITYKTGNRYLANPTEPETPQLPGETSTTEEPHETPAQTREDVTLATEEETDPVIETDPAPSWEKEVSEQLQDISAAYDTLKQVVYRVNQSIVTVTAAKDTVDMFSATYQNISEESGLIIAQSETECYVLTDYSLIMNANDISITYAGGTVVQAVLLAGDATTGLAVICTPIPENETIRIATFGDSGRVEQGDLLVAIGKLYGFSGSMGYGVATATDNIVNDTDSAFQLINTNIVGTESSAGVLANLNGEVVGIITTTYNSGNNNLVTAYAMDGIWNLVENLSNMHQTAYLGIKGQEVTEAIKLLNNLPDGIYVSIVESNSPAYSAGIQTGDVITGINGVKTPTMQKFMAQLSKRNPGDTITIAAKRKGRDSYKEIEFTVVLGVE